MDSVTKPIDVPDTNVPYGENYRLEESLLRPPNNTRINKQNLILRIESPEFTQYQSTAHYPPYPAYVKPDSTPAVPNFNTQLTRSVNTVDLVDPATIPPDLLNTLFVAPRLNISGKTFRRGTDYELQISPLAIEWLEVPGGGSFVSAPILGTNYVVNIQYSTIEYDIARTKAGLLELELLPTLDTDHYHTLWYEVSYLSMETLPNTKKNEIATDPTVFDHRDDSPFHKERWVVPRRRPFANREIIHIGFDELGLLLKGTAQTFYPIWTYIPIELDIKVFDKTGSNITPIDIPVPNIYDLCIVTPEGIIWLNNSVLQSYIEDYLDYDQYRVQFEISYQPAYSISDIYFRKLRPGLYQYKPDTGYSYPRYQSPFNNYFYSLSPPFFYYF